MDLKNATLTHTNVLPPKVGIGLAAVIRSASQREEKIIL